MTDITSELNVSKSNGKARQFIVALVVNLATISFGLNSGWTSPAAPLLRSSHPPVGDTPLTENQITWIVSLSEIGGLLSIGFCGSLADRIGRKNFAISSGLPHIVSWLLIIFAQNYIYLYAAKLVYGVAMSMTFYIVPLYISEIASEDIRGLLGSLLMLTMNIGVLIAFVAGAYLPYHIFVNSSIAVPIVFVVAMFFVPETPACLVRQNRQQQAHKSLMFYRGDNQTLVEKELSEIQSQMRKPDDSRKTVSLREFFGDRASRKGLIVSFGIIMCQAFAGASAITPYAETIFKVAGASISAELASIIFAIIQTIGSQMSTMMMERAGRRLLSLISCLGMAVCLGTVALFFYLQRNDYNVDSISWLPLVGLSGFVITFYLGMGPVPFVIIAELFKLDFTSCASMMSFVFFFIINFISINIFSLSMQYWGGDGCFFMLSVCCLLSFVFCYCMLPETKGRKREDIINELEGIDDSRRDVTKDEDKVVSTQAVGLSQHTKIENMSFYLRQNGYDVNAFSWMPLVALSGYTIAFSLGMGPVPFVILAEVFRLNFTSCASMMSFVFFFIINFLSINLFSLTLQYCGGDGTFFMLSTSCLVSFVFYYLLS